MTGHEGSNVGLFARLGRFLGGHIPAAHDINAGSPEAGGYGGCGLASNDVELAKRFGRSVGNMEDIDDQAMVFGLRHQIRNQVGVDMLLDYALVALEACLGRKAMLREAGFFLRGDWLTLDQCQQGF